MALTLRFAFAVASSFLLAFASLAYGPPEKQQHASYQASIEDVHSFIEQGKTDQALTALARLAEVGKNNPDVMLAVGELFQELAELRADQLQKVAPDSADAHELLGKSFEARGKLDEALTEYHSALDKRPDAPGLHFLIGNVEWKLKNVKAAQTDLAKELAINPHHAMANLRMGQIVLDTQRDEPLRAVAFLQEATADAKSSIEAHRELGKALRLAHDFPGALKELELVEKQNPNDESVHAQLAALFKEMGNQDGARREIALHAHILRQRFEASQKAHSGEVLQP